MYYDSKFISQSTMQKPRSTMWSVGGLCCIVFLFYFVQWSDGVPLTYKDVSEFEIPAISDAVAKESIELKASAKSEDHEAALNRNKRHFDYVEYTLDSSEENNFGYFHKPSHQNFGSYPSSSGYGFWNGSPHHYRARPQYKPHRPDKPCKFPFSHTGENGGSFDFGRTTTVNSVPKPPANIPSSVPSAGIPPSVPQATIPPSAPQPNIPPSVPQANIPPSAPQANIPPSVPQANIPPSAPEANIPPSVPSTTIVTTTTEDIPPIDIRIHLQTIRRKRDEVSVEDIEDQQSDVEFPTRPLFVSQGVTSSPVAVPLDVGITDAPIVEEEKPSTTETSPEHFAPDVTKIEEGNAPTNDKSSEYSIVPAVSYDYYDPSLRRHVSIHHPANDFQSNYHQYYGRYQFPNYHRYPFQRDHQYHHYPSPYSHGYRHNYYPPPPYGPYPTPRPFSQHGHPSPHSFPFIPSNGDTCTDKSAHPGDDFNDDSGTNGKVQDVFESSTEHTEHVSLPIDVRVLKNFN